jgi:hypothetical protein
MRDALKKQVMGLAAPCGALPWLGFVVTVNFPQAGVFITLAVLSGIALLYSFFWLAVAPTAGKRWGGFFALNSFLLIATLINVVLSI